MKFKTLTGGGFDHSTGILTLQGTNSLNKPATVELPIFDAGRFAAELVAVLFRQPDNRPAKTLVVDDVVFSTQGSAADGYDLTFTFGLGAGLKISFSLSAATRSPARVEAIQAHIDQAIADMKRPDDPVLQ
jgi:hypothetical protein